MHFKTHVSQDFAYIHSHQGYHLFRQTKNIVEICDFRIRAEIIDFSRGFRSFRTPEMESSRQVTKIVNFGTVFSQLEKLCDCALN